MANSVTKKVILTATLVLLILLPMVLTWYSPPAYAYDDYEQFDVDPQNPEIQEIIRRECRFPLEDNLAYNLVVLYCALGWRFSYDSSHAHAWQTIPEMLRQNQGVCCDFARLYYSLLRGIGWPENRIEIVYAPLYDLFGNPLGVSHAWVEIKSPSPVGTPLSLSANESVSVFENQTLTMGFNETVLAFPEVTLERIQQVRTLGWGERDGWIPIDPTAGVSWSKIPLIGGLLLSLLPGLYLTFGYNMFYLAGWTINASEVQSWYGPHYYPRRSNPTWDSLTVTIDSGESFNISYLNDIQPYTLRLSLTETINSTLPINVETRDPRMQIIQSASGVTSFDAYVDLDYYDHPPFPKDLGIYWFTVHNPQSVPVNVTFGHVSYTGLGWLGSDEDINQTLYEEYSFPCVTACNESGYFENKFRPDEDVYFKGEDYPGNAQMTIYVIPDGGDATTSNAKALLNKTTDNNGTIAPALLWSHPLNAGNYDIWVDLNQNGLFDGNDTLDVSVNGTFSFSILPPDIAVASVVTSKTIIGQGHELLVNVTIQNQGYFAESFNVTLYANLSVAGQILFSLTAGNQKTMTIAWDTTGFAYGNYAVSAYVWPVPSEANTSNNMLGGGWVLVSISGDVNGDGIIDIFDAILLAGAYNSIPSGSKWNPNADINEDNIVNIFDAILLANNYGKNW